MTGLLTQIVEMESPTGAKSALDRLASFLADQAQALGAEVELLPQANAGDHLRCRWGAGAGGTLLLCHMDTVWDIGTLTERPLRVVDGWLLRPRRLRHEGRHRGGAVGVARALRTMG